MEISSDQHDAIQLIRRACAAFERGGLAAVEDELPGVLSVANFRNNIHTIAYPQVELWSLTDEQLDFLEIVRRFDKTINETLWLPPDVGPSFVELFNPFIQGKSTSRLQIRLYADSHPETTSEEALKVLDRVAEQALAEESPHAKTLDRLRSAFVEIAADGKDKSARDMIQEQLHPSIREKASHVLAHLSSDDLLPPTVVFKACLDIMCTQYPTSGTAEFFEELLILISYTSPPLAWLLENIGRIDETFAFLADREEMEYPSRGMDILLGVHIATAAELAGTAAMHNSVAVAQKSLFLSRQALSMGLAAKKGALKLAALSAHCGIAVDVFKVTQEFGVLEEAVTTGERMIRNVEPESSSETVASGYHNYGLALMKVYENKSATSLLERASEAHSKSVSLTAADSPSRARRLNSLGLALLNQYGAQKITGSIWSRQEALLDDAIQQFNQALECLPPRPLRAMIFMNLGGAFLNKFRKSDDEIDPDLSSIQLLERARVLVNEDASRRALYSMNCGEAYYDIGKITGHDALLASAIDCYEAAIAESASGTMVNVHSKMKRELARRTRVRSSAGKAFKDSDLLVAMTRALDAGLYGQVYEAAGHWADVARASSSWQELAMACDLSISALLSLRRSEHMGIRGDQLFREVSRIAAQRCVALVKLNDHKRAALAAESVRLVELGSRLELDILALEKLRSVDETLYDEYRAVRRNSDALNMLLNSNMEDWFESLVKKHAAESSHSRVLRKIRQVPGFEAVETGPTASDLLEAAHPDPLAFLIASADDIAAIIVTTDGSVDSLMLAQGTEFKLGQMTQVYITAEGESKSNWPAYEDAMLTMTNWLGKYVIWPILSKLPPRSGGVCIIPTGLFSFLPLHASWVADKNSPDGKTFLIENVSVRYLPSIKLAGASRSSMAATSGNEVLVVENPRPSSATYLHGAALEGELIQQRFPRSVRLRHEAASIENVQRELKRSQIVHFATHGYLDLANPLNSGVLLADDQLLSSRTIAEIGASAPALVVLSACDTGFGGMSAPDEAVNLASSLLAVGSSAVIASLWPVSDDATVALMSIFYERLAQGVAASRALREAQLALRFARIPTSSRIELEDDLAWTILAGKFSHPYFWAGFVLTGVDPLFRSAVEK